MFDRLTHKLIYEEIAELIIERIRSGSLSTTQKLPPERVLAEEMLVSRTSLRAALQELKKMGYIYSVTGAGNYINAKAIEELLSPLSVKIAKNKKIAQDIIDVRQHLEVHTAALAAKNATKEQLAQIHEAIIKMQHDVDAGDTGIESDNQFHLEIARASRNEALAIIVEMLHDILAESQKATLAIPGQPQKSITDHLLIYTAICDGDEEKASRSMAEHLEKAYKNLETFTAHGVPV
jgi:GntR family transcriptional repressor for pyruvate dehydrogenase complex